MWVWVWVWVWVWGRARRATLYLRPAPLAAARLGEERPDEERLARERWMRRGRLAAAPQAAEQRGLATCGGREGGGVGW